jgi:hypothetical protein
MNLPKIDLPLYEMALPSTGEKITYRCFTVKEEKIMLIAKESGDTNQIITAIKQILNNCIVDKNIEDLSIFDVEYLLTLIRSKSVSDIVDFSINDPETNEKVNLSIRLDDVKISTNDKHTKEIRLNDQYIMYMKYPNYELFLSAFDPDLIKDPMAYYDIMIKCIDKIASEDTVYKFSDFSREEIDSFIEGLSSDVIEKIQLFFETMPKLKYEVPYTNSNGRQRTYIIEGTESFFV